MPSVVERDALVGNLLDRVDALERRIRYLEDAQPGLGGEAANKLAYYRPDDGSLHGPGDLYLPATYDVHPDGEISWGVWSRMVNRALNPTDHFRSGAIPTGFSWIADGTFNGAPGSLLYAFRDTYLAVGTATAPNFLADAITVYAGKLFAARLMTWFTTELGVRLDDGSDNNYAEIILDPDDLGSYTIDFRYRAGGGGVTDTPGPSHLASEGVVVELYWYAATPAVYGYLMGEHGGELALTGFNTGAVAWTPSRVGLVVRGNNGAYAFCDWIYSEFS